MVNLFIHPYDYEEALTLIEELFRSNMNPSPKWRKQWDEYLSNIPNYYIPHFRFVPLQNCDLIFCNKYRGGHFIFAHI